MSSPLQKAPRGYLGALDLKTIGRNPTLAPDELSTTFDATDLYEADLAQIATQAATLTAVNDENSMGFGTGSTVNPGFSAKLINTLWASITVATADVGVIYALQYNRPGEAQYTPVVWAQAAKDFLLPAAGSYTLLLYKHFERPLVLLPGSRVRIICLSAPAAGRASTIGATHISLP